MQLRIQEFVSSSGAGVWRKALGALPDSSSVLDISQSASLAHRFLTVMRAEIVAYVIYLEGPEYPEYVMHLFCLKYSGTRNIGICEESNNGRWH